MKRWILPALMAVVVGLCSSPAFAQAKAAAAKRSTGTVKAVSADSLTVSGAGGKEMMFAVDASTKVVATGAGTKSAAAGGKLVITDAVKMGDRVTVSYHDMGGKMHAAEVRVTAKAATK